MAPLAAVNAQDNAARRCLASAVSHRATWASFLSRPRAHQPKCRQRHGATRCSKLSRHAAVSPTGPQVLGERGDVSCDELAFQAAQGFFSPSAGNGMAPLAAISVQGIFPRHPQAFDKRRVASCDVGKLSSRLRALQTKRRQRHGAPRRSERARQCRPQMFGERGVASCDVGQLFKPPKGSSDQATKLARA